MWQFLIRISRIGRRAAKSFESLAGYTPYSLTMSGDSAPESLDVARVTPDFFPTLGVSPVLGRDFEAC